MTYAVIETNGDSIPQSCILAPTQDAAINQAINIYLENTRADHEIAHAKTQLKECGYITDGDWTIAVVLTI